MENKYKTVLTIVLSIVVIAVLVLLCFLGVDVYKKFATKKAIAEVVGEYDTAVNETNTEESNTEIPMLNEDLVTNTTSGNASKVTYKGYDVVGKIEIPKISLNYPILDNPSASAMELSVILQYGPGPNKVGNTVIAGHNYRNGSFFGKNKKLQLGDKVYITDNSGTRIQYNIYNIYETSPDDSDFYTRDTKGKREISLTTCTDNSKARLIIWAVEE